MTPPRPGPAPGARGRVASRDVASSALRVTCVASASRRVASRRVLLRRVASRRVASHRVAFKLLLFVAAVRTGGAEPAARAGSESSFNDGTTQNGTRPPIRGSRFAPQARAGACGGLGCSSMDRRGGAPRKGMLSKTTTRDAYEMPVQEDCHGLLL